VNTLFTIAGRFARVLDAVTRRLCAGLLALLFVLMFSGVVLRQAFNSGSIYLQDLSAYSFAVLIMLAMPAALTAGRHVRADILDRRISKKNARCLQVAAYWIFLLPAFLVTLVYALPDLIFSWRILEGSGEPEGLGGYFLVKSTLVVMCGLMILQGFTHTFQKPKSGSRDKR